MQFSLFMNPACSNINSSLRAHWNRHVTHMWPTYQWILLKITANYMLFVLISAYAIISYFYNSHSVNFYKAVHSGLEVRKKCSPFPSRFPFLPFPRPTLLMTFLLMKSSNNTLHDSTMYYISLQIITTHALWSVLAMWHTVMVSTRKEVAVWFAADPGSAGVWHTHCPTSSPESNSGR